MVVVGALTLLGVSPASAAPPPPQFTGPAVTSVQVAAAAKAEAAVTKLRSTLTTVGGLPHFDASAALDMGADPATVEQVAAGITAAGGTVSGIAVKASDVAAGTAAIAASRASCAGQTSYSIQWFGYQLKLNSCVTNAVIGGLSAGAGAAGIAAIIASETGIGGLAGGLLAGILAIGAGVLGICASSGNGVIVDLSWAGVPWCASQ